MSTAPIVEPRVLEPGCEWTAGELADEDTWTEHLVPAELDELDAALRHAMARSEDPLELTVDDFPLASLADHLGAVERELINGRGFVRLRGIDRSAYTQDEMELLYWGIGLHLGLPLAQNKHGHVLMELRPGDIQFINNFHVLHGRTAYEDDRAGGQVRHLKRLWLETDELASRPPHFARRSHWESNRSTSRLRVAGG